MIIKKLILDKYIKDFKEISNINNNLSFDKINDIVSKTQNKELKLISKKLLLEVFTKVKSKDMLVKKLRSVMGKHFKTRYLNTVNSLDPEHDQIYISRLKSRSLQKRKQTLAESIKSSIIILLLKEHMKTTIDNDLLDNLDFNSLIRLSLAKGGEDIKVPTYYEVEKSIAEVYYSYLRLFEGLTEDDALTKTKKDLDIGIKRIEAREGYSKIALLYSKEVRNEGSDINSTFINLLNLLKKLQRKLEDSVSNIETPKDFMVVYNDVTNSFLELTRSLSQIKGLV